MSDFTDAIQHNWPDYVISPGASASCQECRNVYGFELADTDTPADNETVFEDIDAMQERLYEFCEGSFSWSDCDSCGSILGGTREEAHAIHREAFGPNAKRPDDIHHISICTDCMLFHANGDEPENWEAA